jgi:hypothetical protein
MAAVLMHHDAITGTHSLKVKRDYEYRLEEANNHIKETNLNLLNAVNKFHAYARGTKTSRLQMIARSILN